MSDVKPITAAQIEEAERLCAEATEGPWRVYTQIECGCDDCGDDKPLPHHDAACVPEACVIDTDDGDYMSHENCKFIAAARTLLPAALSGIKDRDARIETLKNALESVVIEQGDVAWAEDVIRYKARIAELEAVVGELLAWAKGVGGMGKFTILIQAAEAAMKQARKDGAK